jgi:hypothetical protein
MQPMDKETTKRELVGVQRNVYVCALCAHSSGGGSACACAFVCAFVCVCATGSRLPSGGLAQKYRPT